MLIIRCGSIRFMPKCVGSPALVSEATCSTYCRLSSNSYGKWQQLEGTKAMSEININSHGNVCSIGEWLAIRRKYTLVLKTTLCLETRKAFDETFAQTDVRLWNISRDIWEWKCRETLLVSGAQNIHTHTRALAHAHTSYSLWSQRDFSTTKGPYINPKCLFFINNS